MVVVTRDRTTPPSDSENMQNKLTARTERMLRLFAIGSKLPGPLKALAKCAYYNLTWRKTEKNTIMLNSIQKSGMNYFRIIMANYLFLYYYDNIDEPITYDQMHTEIFPNGRGYYLQKSTEYQIPHEIMKSTPYKDLIWGHKNTALEYCDAKIIFLYRNPLDNVVSMYYYKWKNREATKNFYNHPREVIDIVLDDFIHRYNFMKKVSRKRGNALLVSYESIKRSPEITFSIILNWLGLPVHMGKVKKAVEFSDIRLVRKHEKERGQAIHSPEGFMGSFARSGEIGQWKKYLDEADLAYIREKLHRADISLDEFLLE